MGAFMVSEPNTDSVDISQSNVWIDLSHDGIIRVEGKDALSFLQGQLTCDVREVTSDQSRLGAWCTAKGRVKVIFRVIFRKDGFELALPAELVKNTLSELRQYIFQSKVTLAEVSDKVVRIGCAGHTIKTALQNLFSNLPEGRDQVIQQDGLVLLRRKGILPTFEMWGEVENVKKAWEALKPHATPVDLYHWSILEVLSGVPIITQATTEDFSPHMLNLPELDAVSFRKGCYVGQEIVARTQYLGKSKRRLYLASVKGTPRPGDLLWVPGAEESAAGRVVNVAPFEEGECWVLVVHSSETPQVGVRLGNQEGPELVFQQT
ncbi:tRNA-modifying protein YgfZ [Gammaproteobacteria bacterium]